MITSTSEAPSFSLTLNNKYVSGTYRIIDLSWYAPYKEYGDNIICMFFYLIFIWHTFKTLPNTIRGANSDFKTITGD